MNSAMLSLALDPKGNTVNNERRGEKRKGGGGSRERESERDGEREVLQTVTGWWEGNLLVFSHQLGRRGDINRIGGRGVLQELAGR